MTYRRVTQQLVNDVELVTVNMGAAPADREVTDVSVGESEVLENYSVTWEDEDGDEVTDEALESALNNWYNNYFTKLL